MNVIVENKIILTLSEAEARMLAQACLDYTRMHEGKALSTDPKISEITTQVWDYLADVT